MKELTCAQVSELAAEYVLHTLEPSAESAVRRHLSAHPDGHPEYAELAQAAPAMAYLAEPVDPPARLKARVLAAAAGAEQLSIAAAIAAPAPTLLPTATPRSETAPRSGGWRAAVTARRLAATGWATAAVAVAIVAAMVFTGLQTGPRSNDTGIASRFERAMSLAAAPGSRLAVIGSSGGAAGAAGSPVPSGGSNGIAVIPRTGPGLLVMAGLPATTGSTVYEAWAIVGSQAPAPLGSFAVGSDATGWLDSLTVPPGEGLVVALTREPGPGATKPTLPIVASGSAH